MKTDASILAIVPARSGSKGIPDKNLAQVGGVSLIGLAGECISELSWIDEKIISTDSQDYADEGLRYGLQCLGLRPANLSDDTANVLDVMEFELLRAEETFDKEYAAVILIEPTSPLRTAGDIEFAVDRMFEEEAASVVTISPASTKHHPRKSLCIESGVLRRYLDQSSVVSRQELDTTYLQNGFCYGIMREALLEKRGIFLESTTFHLTDRPYANIDDPIDLMWASFLAESEER
ncbi:MAG: acylneuraminate cytidylyltransferase family protein [Pseudomonadales bacterium]|nr:acylneuraminate cytidylyltransferase family protein [Pseudomonadales bacterium]MBO7004796.1 acylneuraminate cytidylyltransferase family protein [Pseudomonadales bacterium]